MNLNMIPDLDMIEEKFKKKHNELKKTVNTGQSGAGLVTVKMDGLGNLTEIKIDPSATKDLEVLEELILGAVADCRKKTNKIQGDALDSLMEDED